MKKNTGYTLALLYVSFIMSCSSFPPKNDSQNYMGFDDVKYVSSFPLEFILQGKKTSNIDIIGIRSFAILDTLLIFSTVNDDGLWSFVSLETEKELNRFLTKGQGPFQFIFPPSVDDKVKFSNENNNTIAYIYDLQKGELLRMNVDESFRSNKLDISVAIDTLPPFLFNFIMIDSSTFFCKALNNTHTQQLRYISDNQNGKTTPAPLEILNNAAIDQGQDINILSTITKRNPRNEMMVEMPIGLNYINLYKLDGSFARTVCIGKKLDHIGKIQDKRPWKRIYTYSDLRVFDGFFGIVRINEEEKTYQVKRKKLPAILLFDWDGNPIAELKLNHHITSFDIDFNNGILYTLDLHSDEFFKYDIRDILAKI